MIQTQDLEGYPVFAGGKSASRAKPGDAKYESGFLPSDTLPAEWANWFWNKSSAGVRKLNAGVLALETEVNAVLAAGGQVPDGYYQSAGDDGSGGTGTGNQLLVSVRAVSDQQINAVRMDGEDLDAVMKART